MSVTTINIDAFEFSFRSGLLFSIYEGLRPGEAFKVVSKKSLDEIYKQFVSTQVENLKLENIESQKDLYQVEIKKVAQQKVGCCGMCGG